MHLPLFDETLAPPSEAPSINLTPKLYDLDKYYRIIVSFSGGKDSLALVLYLLDQGVPPEKMELWHQEVEGSLNYRKPLFDWPSTHGYVQAIAKHLGIDLWFQFRAYGIRGELFKTNRMSQDIWYYKNDEEELAVCLPTIKASVSTRRKFPMKTGDLSRRWCSSSAKIACADKALTNRPDLKGDPDAPKRILFLTGERRQESRQRSLYDEVFYHKAHSRSREVHHWRAVIDFPEELVWSLMERHGIIPHPAYYLGFPRLSCMCCIFFSPDHWATLAEINPATIQKIALIEKRLGFTMDNKHCINEMVAMGKSRIPDEKRSYIQKALSLWASPVVTAKWELPAGAFSSGGGPV